jgi:hypothetical protein
VIIVGETFARRHWPGENPLGKRILLGKPGAAPWLSVVGVVADVKHRSLAEEAALDLYRPYESPAGLSFVTSIVLRSSGDPLALANAVRAAIHGIDPDIPVSELSTLEAAVRRSYADQRAFLAILGGFAGVGLLLAAGGIFGAVSYAVSQRTREMGVRLAVGAEPDQVVALVVRQSLRAVFGGLAAGIIAAFGVARVLAGKVWGVQAIDPVVLATAAALLLGASVLAAWIPARRAARINPVAALRAE